MLLTVGIDYLYGIEPYIYYVESFLEGTQCSFPHHPRPLVSSICEHELANQKVDVTGTLTT
jgi:hypothetical protein